MLRRVALVFGTLACGAAVRGDYIPAAPWVLAGSLDQSAHMHNMASVLRGLNASDKADLMDQEAEAEF
jgi:hypothetical protein